MPAKPKPLTAAPNDIRLPAVDYIPAKRFRRYPVNRLITEKDIQDMSASIREEGVLQPITARPLPNPETEEELFEIVMGTCRWLGCLDIDDDYPVPCFVRDLTDKEAARIHSIENFRRKDMDAIDAARDIAHLREQGWKVEEIMEFLGMSKDFVYQRLNLLKLDDDAQQAFRDGDLSIHTALKLISIPEEKRPEALKAVISPTRSAKALPEREALALLESEFIQPEQAAKEWEKRRDAILENHPGAKWNAYEEARKIGSYQSGHVSAERKPGHHLLSDAASAGELVVPTWGELARKHGAPMEIGCDYQDQAGTYVIPEPLIEAEKAACNDTPNECIFEHEAAITQAREDAERRKLEKEAHTQAVADERRKVVDLVLSPDGISKTAMKKIVETCFVTICENYTEIADIGKALGMDDDADGDDIDAAITKYLRSKSLTPLEAMGRLQLAGLVADGYFPEWLEVFFEANALKAAGFPALHKEYEELVARREQQRKNEEQQAAARAKAQAEQEAAA